MFSVGGFGQGCAPAAVAGRNGACGQQVQLVPPLLRILSCSTRWGLLWPAAALTSFLNQAVDLLAKNGETSCLFHSRKAFYVEIQSRR